VFGITTQKANTEFITPHLKEQTMSQVRDEDIVKLEFALEHINLAIDQLSEIDGMESIMEELNVQAVMIEDEIAELESLLDEEPDPGEMVEWHDFDPDC
jgi:hypothetical protein